MPGRTYWRIVESRRVRGKPRPVPVLYLGSADELLNRLLEAPQRELRIRSFQHGDVAALRAAAARLGVVGIIDRHVPGRARGLSVGTVLLFISEPLRQGQIRGLIQQVKKAIRQLDRWKVQLAKPCSGPRTADAAQRHIQTLLLGQHISRVLKVGYDPARAGPERLHYQLDTAATDALAHELYGKRFLITDRND